MCWWFMVSEGSWGYAGRCERSGCFIPQPCMAWLNPMQGQTPPAGLMVYLPHTPPYVSPVCIYWDIYTDIFCIYWTCTRLLTSYSSVGLWYKKRQSSCFACACVCVSPLYVSTLTQNILSWRVMIVWYGPCLSSSVTCTPPGFISGCWRGHGEPVGLHRYQMANHFWIISRNFLVETGHRNSRFQGAFCLVLMGEYSSGFNTKQMLTHVKILVVCLAFVYTIAALQTKSFNHQKTLWPPSKCAYDSCLPALKVLHLTSQAFNQFNSLDRVQPPPPPSCSSWYRLPWRIQERGPCGCVGAYVPCDAGLPAAGCSTH